MPTLGRRLRNRFDGSGPLVAASVVFFVFSVLALLVELQSPDLLLWTGQAVPGNSQGGIVYYAVQGRDYTINDPGAPANSPERPVTVFVDPANPSGGITDDVVNRVTDALAVGLPFLIGVGFLGLALTKRARWRRHEQRAALRGDRRFGVGLDPEFVARQLRRSRE